MLGNQLFKQCCVRDRVVKETKTILYICFFCIYTWLKYVTNKPTKKKETDKTKKILC